MSEQPAYSPRVGDRVRIIACIRGTHRDQVGVVGAVFNDGTCNVKGDEFVCVAAFVAPVEPQRAEEPALPAAEPRCPECRCLPTAWSGPTCDPRTPCECEHQWHNTHRKDVAEPSEGRPDPCRPDGPVTSQPAGARNEAGAGCYNAYIDETLFSNALARALRDRGFEHVWDPATKTLTVTPKGEEQP